MKGSINLKDACGCVNKNINKKCLSNIFKLFFKKQYFKKFHLNTTDGGIGRPQPSFFQRWGGGKIKPNKWVEMSPKMRNLHRFHCLQKFSKYEKKKKKKKQTKWGTTVPPSVS